MEEKKYTEITPGDVGVDVDPDVDPEGMYRNADEETGLISSPPEYEIVSDYRVTQEGVFCFRPERQEYKMLSRTVFLPTRLYFNEDTEEEKVEIQYHAHGKWRSFICGRADLDDLKYLKKELKKRGIEIDVKQVDEICGYLNSCILQNKGRAVGIVRTTDHLGWYRDEEDGSLEFVPYSERIYYSGREMEKKQVDQMMAPRGTLKAWVKLMNTFRDADHVPARLMLAAGFASVLVKILEAQSFAVDIWGGESGSGKSISLSNAVSIWAKPGLGDGYIWKADSTDLSLENVAAIYNHLPVAVDETSTEDDGKKLARFVYNICSEISHGAMSAGGTLREQKHWANCAILTGEKPITTERSLAGSVNRVIEIEAPAHVFWNDPPRLMRHLGTLRKNHGVAGRLFVEKLREEKNAEYAREIFHGYYEELSGMATGKQAESAAVLLTADRLAAEWVFGDALMLTAEDIRPFVRADREVSTNERAHQLILEWVATNGGKFSYGGFNKWGRFGHRDGQETVEIVRSVLNDFLRRAGFSDRSYLSWARKTGKLYTDPKDPGHNDVAGNFNGVRVRFVCIYGDGWEEDDEANAAILRLKKLLELDTDAEFDEYLQKTGNSGDAC